MVGASRGAALNREATVVAFRPAELCALTARRDDHTVPAKLTRSSAAAGPYVR